MLGIKLKMFSKEEVMFPHVTIKITTLKQIIRLIKISRPDFPLLLSTHNRPCVVNCRVSQVGCDFVGHVWTQQPLKGACLGWR